MEREKQRRAEVGIQILPGIAKYEQEVGTEFERLPEVTLVERRSGTERRRNRAEEMREPTGRDPAKSSALWMPHRPALHPGRPSRCSCT